jgi:hypothetical protein
MLITIKEAVEKVTGLQIDKDTRKREYVVARCLYYHFAREITGKPLSQISALMNKNHASVIHSLKKFDVHYRFDTFFKKSFHALEIILEPTPSVDEIVAEVGSIEEVVNQRQRLINANAELKLEITKLKDNKPQIERLFDGIPEDRIQFFINNQMATFIKMERALLKQRKELRS